MEQEYDEYPRGDKIKLYILTFLVILIPLVTILYAHYYPNGRLLGGKAESHELKVKSIDTQIVTKHWKEKDPDRVKEQVKMLKELGVNFVAISTPYDYPEVTRVWAEELHNQGIFAWYRSHWLNWEGDEGKPADMTPDQYLAKTKEYILQNRDIFRVGDSFTVCIEPEQVGVEKDGKFKTWGEYNNFLIKQMDTANEAFTEIDMQGKVTTNWLSMNGWVAMQGLDKKVVDKAGMITIDHYATEDVTLPPAVIADNQLMLIDQINQKWQVPIMIGEWGYSINQEVSDFQQKQVVNEVMKRVTSRPYIYGINYWDHMGNSSRVIDDKQGQHLSYRPAALVIRDYFNK